MNGRISRRNMESEALESDVRNRMKKTKAAQRNPAVDRHLYFGTLRLHVLYHAAYRAHSSWAQDIVGSRR